MRVIAHRGNLHGPNPDLENYPPYVAEALQKGYDVEVDVWCIGGQWYFGHDRPQYFMAELSRAEGVWYHAKNLAAVEGLNAAGVHWFWHETDHFVLTSWGYAWVYPGLTAPKGGKSVVVLRGRGAAPVGTEAVCTDYAGEYRVD